MKIIEHRKSQFKTVFVLGILLILLSMSVYADTIQELESQLEDTVGTDRIDILIKMSEMETDFNPQKSLELANQALSEAQTLDDAYSIIDARNQLGGYVHIVLEDSQAASDAFQKSYAEAVPLGITKVRHLVKMGMVFSGQVWRITPKLLKTLIKPTIYLVCLAIRLGMPSL